MGDSICVTVRSLFDPAWAVTQDRADYRERMRRRLRADESATQVVKPVPNTHLLLDLLLGRLALLVPEEFVRVVDVLISAGYSIVPPHKHSRLACCTAVLGEER